MKRLHRLAAVDTPVNIRSVVCWYVAPAVTGYAGHVRTVGSGKRVAAWGCTNRISNGRSVCDSHHINEDVLEHTIRAAFDGMEDVLDVVEESCAEVLEADNHTELEQVQQDIIAIQEAVLSLHKAQQQGAVSEMDYEIKIASYSQQMDELQERQRELKATAGTICGSEILDGHLQGTRPQRRKRWILPTQ